jgi:hypothetical protein
MILFVCSSLQPFHRYLSITTIPLYSGFIFLISLIFFGGQMMTEFGAVTNSTKSDRNLKFLTETAEKDFQGWIYWQFKFFQVALPYLSDYFVDCILIFFHGYSHEIFYRRISPPKAQASLSIHPMGRCRWIKSALSHVRMPERLQERRWPRHSIQHPRIFS